MTQTEAYQKKIMVYADGLRKEYTVGPKKDSPPLIAVDHFSCSIRKGEIFGLIGPDGAGKTSIMRMLTTMYLPNGGTAIVNGYDIKKDIFSIRKTIGYMPGKFSLYLDLTVRENINFFAAVYHTSLKENYHLVKDIYDQIAPFEHRRAGALSGGMKQKLALCCALIHKPDILFLDEPTTGVDAISRKEFWWMLKKLKQDGITIVVSTPYMDEASQCDRVALLQKGMVLTSNTVENIVAQFPYDLYACTSEDKYQLDQTLKLFPEILLAYPFGINHHILTKRNSISELQLQLKIQTKLPDATLHREVPNIEDCFIALMQINSNV